MERKENTTRDKQRLVVLGGGFAGLSLVRHINLDKYDVTLVDANNFHSFPPLFYQIASSGIAPLDICFPFRKELRRRLHRGVRFVIGRVTGIDVTSHTVTTDTDIITYDRLVIATGTTNNFFGNTGLVDKVYTMKSPAEAVRVRNDILKSLELASVESDPERRRRLLSFVVIGGGPSGVEVAGALGEMKRYIISREYPDINPDEISIKLVEGSDRLLRTMSPTASEYARKALDALMVDVYLGHNMHDYDGYTATLDDGTQLHAGMVVWTAGVTGNSIPLNGCDIKPGRGGRYVTDRFNRVIGVDDVFALGDIALIQGDAKWPDGHPQLAQPAMQQARRLADNLNRESFGKSFSYRDKGSMATIGRNRAVADLHKLHLTGFLAWGMWMFIHLISILGMRNRMSVLVSWIWSYFTYTDGSRVLLGPADEPARHKV